MSDDVIIIGAGPAGCVAAVVLAGRGRRVTLIEQHRFPRDKVCGECVSALGIETLERVGLAAAIRALRPVELRRSCLVARDGTEATIDLPRPMWGLTRVALDAALLDHARAVGANVLQPARCEHVGIDPLTVSIRDLSTNAIETIRPSYVLVGDGKGALGVTSGQPTGDLGVKVHFDGVRDDGEKISLFGVDGHYVGLAPVEGRRWNVAMSVPAERVRALGGDFDALFEQMKRENAGLARRFERATRASTWLASPLPRFAVNSPWPRRVIPIGNAAAALEPIGGEGMGLAMRSGELAAEAVDEALRTGREMDQAALRRSFQRLWRSRRAAARAAGLIISSSPFSRVAVAVLNVNGRTADPVLSLLGKTSA